MKYVLLGIIALWVIMIRSCIITDKHYSNAAGEHWNSVEATSTVEEKAVAIDKYVAAVDSLHLEGKNSAVFVVRDVDTYEYNHMLIEDLQYRIHEIAAMPDSSVEKALNYKQLTDRLDDGGFSPQYIMSSIYTKTHAPWIWLPFGFLIFLITGLLFIFLIDL